MSVFFSSQIIRIAYFINCQCNLCGNVFIQKLNSLRRERKAWLYLVRMNVEDGATVEAFSFMRTFKRFSSRSQCKDGNTCAVSKYCAFLNRFKFKFIGKLDFRQNGMQHIRPQH